MTEYDYSPDMIKQYLATQNRVSNWVHHTKRHTPGNPFTPSTRPSSPTKPDNCDSRARYPESMSRTSSDETCTPRSKARYLSSNMAPEIGYLPSSFSRSAPSRCTEQSARYTEPSYHPHQSNSTRHSSLTITSRHTHKSTKRRTVEARKHRATPIPRSEDKKGYILHVKEGHKGMILDPFSFLRMEVCISFSLLLLLFLSWWATSENLCVDSAGLVTHTCSDASSATMSTSDMDKKKV